MVMVMVMVVALGKGWERRGGEGALWSGCLRAWAGWLVLRRFWVLGGDVTAGVQAGT